MRIQADRSRLILRVGSILVGCVICFLLMVPKAPAQTAAKRKAEPKPEIPLAAHGTIEVGVQARDTQGGHTAKFQELRDVPKGFFIRKLAVDIDSVDSPYSFKLRGFEIGQHDQRFSLDARKVGKYRGEFVWDETPHYFGTGQTFLQETSPGLYQVNPTLRATLQSLTLRDNVRTPVD
ncbi:MAG: hypothetical protein ABR530_06215, partial [Pyrinomonadaceae bacterium]